MGRGRIRPESIASDMQGTIEEEPKTESPAAAFVAGAKAIVPVLLAPIPFGVAFGATAVDNGLSTIEALGMSVLDFAPAAMAAKRWARSNSKDHSSNSPRKTPIRAPIRMRAARER
jgi:hypothetical protein